MSMEDRRRFRDVGGYRQFEHRKGNTVSQQIVTIKTTVDQAAYLKRLVLNDQKRLEDVLTGMDPAHVPDDLQTEYLHNEAIRQIL